MRAKTKFSMKLSWVCCLLSVLLTCAASAADIVGVWWWHGADAKDPKVYSPRFDFLSKRGINEIFFCVDRHTGFNDLVAFVREANRRGMRVSWLGGDVSWIFPGNLGFDETFRLFAGYQKKAPADARFYALHLDVEPHQDGKLANERKWQLYADLVLRACACAHRQGEKIEWDIPFWLDGIKVQSGYRADTPLLEVVMDHADGVTLMSYRNTAKQMLDVSKTEIELGADRPCRVLLGAETGKSEEGDFVSYYSSGAAVLKRELEKVRTALRTAHLRSGGGVAVHHLGSWEKLETKTP